MFEKLKELINNLSDEKKKEFLAELANVKKTTDNMITKPKNLDSILTDEKFTELKKEYDVKIGKLRNDWDANNKKIEVPEKDDSNDFQKSVLESLNAMTSKIASLESQKKVADLQNFANEKLKEVKNENMRGLINISPDMTEDQIIEKVENLKQIEADLTKNATSTDVYQGSNSEIPNAALNSVISEMKTELNIDN